jgi:putative endonuclease
MTDKIKKGNEGEQVAADFLTKKGYEIVERNFRYRRSEIDLIVKKDNFLVFVEVKMRSSAAFGFPEESVNEKKVSKVLEGAEYYLFAKNWQGNVRYDIIAISMRGDQAQIEHLEDAFY